MASYESVISRNKSIARERRKNPDESILAFLGEINKNLDSLDEDADTPDPYVNVSISPEDPRTIEDSSSVEVVSACPPA